MTKDGSIHPIDPERLPAHIAIIMDGNGRWAKKRFLPRVAGHEAGAKAVDRVVTYCCQIGVKALTLYSFSSENWKRPKIEVSALMRMLKRYVDKELARMVGYDRIPSTTMADALPPQLGNPAYEWEDHLRDLLATIGFDEVVSYRLTSPEREALLGITGPHLQITNPIAPERSVMRRSLLASVLDNLERNIRWSESLAFFEIGPVFEPSGRELPNEPRRLALAMTGLRHAHAWDTHAVQPYDFYDLKGRLELMFHGLHLRDVVFAPASGVSYLHPGESAEVTANGRRIGVFGELHPVTREGYDLGSAAVLVADLDLDAMRELGASFQVTPVAEFPPVLEDIAVILDEAVPAASVEAVIREAGGPSLVGARLFDLYRGEQIGASKKSLAYNLTYQAQDRTLTDAEASAIRNRVVKKLEQELGAALRG